MTFTFRPATAREEAVLILRTTTNTGGEFLRSTRATMCELLTLTFGPHRAEIETTHSAY